MKINTNLRIFRSAQTHEEQRANQRELTYREENLAHQQQQAEQTANLWQQACEKVEQSFQEAGAHIVEQIQDLQKKNG